MHKLQSSIADWRIKREILMFATLTIIACSPIVASTNEVSVDKHVNAPLFKKRLGIVAVGVLGGAIPFILDAGLLEDHRPVVQTSSACVAPKVGR